MMLGAAALICLIVGITDGDTLTARCPERQIKVRLAEIDAPEKKQPWGERSRQSLAELCFQKKAKIQPVSRDRYGRTVAKVACDDLDANAEQVKRGMAWVYDKYAKDDKLYEQQEEARKNRQGLWADMRPVPPWEWRHSRRKVRQPSSLRMAD